MLSGGGRKLRREQSLRGAADGFDNNNFSGGGGGGGLIKQPLGKNVSTPLNGGGGGGMQHQSGAGVKPTRSVTAVNHGGHAALTRNGPAYGRSGGVGGGGGGNRVAQNSEQQQPPPTTANRDVILCSREILSRNLKFSATKYSLLKSLK